MALEEFKGFLKEHPLLKNEVREKKRTWQEIYDEWKLMPNDPSWGQYKDGIREVIKTVENQEFLKNILDYAKKIKPDTITNTLSTVQKTIGMFQGFSKTKSSFSPYASDSIFKNDFKGF